MTHHFQTTVQRVFRLDLSMLRHQLHAANSTEFSNVVYNTVRHRNLFYSAWNNLILHVLRNSDHSVDNRTVKQIPLGAVQGQFKESQNGGGAMEGP